MRFVSFCMLCTAPFFLMAQDPREKRIDSLENELNLAKVDTTRVNILCRLTYEYGGLDSVNTFDRGFRALKLAKKIDYLKGMVDAHITLGGGYMDYFDLEKAEAQLTKGNFLADKLVKKDSSKAHMALWMRGRYNLAINYGYKGEHDREMEYTMKVVPIAEKQGDSIFLAKIYTNLGINNFNRAAYKEAYGYFRKSESYYRDPYANKDFLFNRISFSNVLYKLDSLDRMKSVLEQAETLLNRYPNELDLQSYHTQMGTYFTAMEKYPQAFVAFDAARSIIEKNKMHGHLPGLLQKYAFAYEKMGNHHMAALLMTDFLNSAIESQNGINIFQAHYKRSQYEAAEGKFEAAYNDLLRAVDVYDSLEMLESNSRIKQLELEYETTKKEKEILELRNKNGEAALSLEKKRSQTYLMAITIGTLVFLLSVGYLFYRNKMRNARRKERVQKAEVDLLKQEQQNKIFSAMIEGQEKERKRLAIDLHDGLGGRLSGISMKLSKLEKENLPEPVKKHLGLIHNDLNTSLGELRGIARNLMPETLMKFGLEAALKDYCSSMTSHDTKVTLQFYGPETGMDHNGQVTIYRIIQELINNAVKHAKATEILVQFIREGKYVNVTVEDNGIGFEAPENDTDSAGMGLKNIKTRVAYLKGAMDFQSVINEGTSVNFQITV
ncbi:MAG: histidine kinase [Sediminicola sp.]